MRLATLSAALVAGLTLALAGAAPVTVTGQSGDLGLGVYADINFRGLSATFVRDTPDLRPSGLDGRISSLKVAPGEVWEACTEVNFGGRCQVFSADQNDLRRGGWNDTIRSVRRLRGNGPGPGRGTGGNGPETRGLELFAGLSYSGQRKLITEASSNLRREGFNDRAHSLRVPRGEVWEVCVNAEFDDCRIVDEDVPDLSVLGLSREISSARPRPFGRGGRGIGNRIVLYEGANYRGRTTTIVADTPNLTWFRNTAGSVRVYGGRWELCDQPRYGGRCVLVVNDVPDLSRLRLDDRVSSLRVR